MIEINVTSIQKQLTERRDRLQESIKYVPDPTKLFGLLQQVDSALERIDNGSFGICDVCHDPIEDDRLLVDPLLTVCLDHLNHQQKKALEQDLEFAIKIQRNLLPENNVVVNGWEFSYNYTPAGAVSGDFCDLIKLDDESVLFVLGDVSGKGISASLMMSHLNALIKSLLSFNLPVNEIVTRANRLFCESTLSTHYATMVFGRAGSGGEIELCIAGHNPPILINNNGASSLTSTGVPIGLFCQSDYAVTNIKLQKGDSLILYTDGLTEAMANDTEYGEERLKRVLLKSSKSSTHKIMDDIISDQRNFLNGSPRSDDVTIAVLKRA